MSTNNICFHGEIRKIYITLLSGGMYMAATIKSFRIHVHCIPLHLTQCAQYLSYAGD